MNMQSLLSDHQHMVFDFRTSAVYTSNNLMFSVSWETCTINVQSGFPSVTNNGHFKTIFQVYLYQLQKLDST